MSQPLTSSDFERRFGGLRRLYGAEGAQAIFQAHAIVVGLGGVGSWAAEALARSGVGRLTLVDLDHISESNINRQVHALGATTGQSKIEAMRDRIADINPLCTVDLIDEFVTPDNLAAFLDPVRQHGAPAVLDACDQVGAKTALAAWSQVHGLWHVTVGAAGGKRLAHRVEMGDLAEVTHDPLLAQLRYRLRKHHAAPRDAAMGVTAVFSRESVASPDVCASTVGEVIDGTLNCHGYGSVVSVTATFGLVAAGWLLDIWSKKIEKRPFKSKKQKNDAII